MKMLLITDCPDPFMWYANKVDELVPYRGTWAEGYHSVDDSGYTNIVKFGDAKIVEID